MRRMQQLLRAMASLNAPKAEARAGALVAWVEASLKGDGQNCGLFNCGGVASPCKFVEICRGVSNKT